MNTKRSLVVVMAVALAAAFFGFGVPQASADVITTVTATASSVYSGGWEAYNCVDGDDGSVSGLHYCATDNRWEHGTGYQYYTWMANTTASTQYISFNLGGLYSLGTLEIWNMNASGAANGGVKTLPIYSKVNPTDAWALWNTVTLTQAPVDQHYAGETVNLNGLKAGYVSFGIAANPLVQFATNYTSLSEVRFNGTWSPPGPGELITGVKATASSTYPGGYEPFNCVDGDDGTVNGLHYCATDSRWEHGTGYTGYIWMAYDKPSEWIKFDLGHVYSLGRLEIWNTNSAGASVYGIKTLPIYYKENDGDAWTYWKTVTLVQAPENQHYAGETLDLTGLSARYVSFGKDGGNYLVSYGGYPSLSEVQFYVAETVIPEPAGLGLVGMALLAFRRRRK